MGNTLTVTPLSDALGADVHNIDLRALDEHGVCAIRAAWMRYQVLRFRNQTLDDAALVAFSRYFGDLDLAPRVEQGVRDTEGYPEILVVSNVVENGREIGSLGHGEAVWHTDMSYVAAPPLGSVLYALEVPDRGGNTGFLNTYRGLDTMAPCLRNRVNDLVIKHDATTTSAGHVRKGMGDVDDLTQTPGTDHHAIRTHPETGRDAIYLGRRHRALAKGMSIEASEILLDEIWAHVTRPDFSWTQRWQAGDLLIWDNRCTMHRRDAFDANARRIMHRTQIKGTAPFRLRNR